MKKLTLITVLLLAFTLGASSQSFTNKTNVHTRFACPNVTKDTLFVVNEMYMTMKTLWDDPSYKEEKPVIVSVKVLDPNVLKSSMNGYIRK